MSATLRHPNVLWIFGDQHRGQALSCMGDPNVNTPAIDRMMTEGAHFPAAVAGMPLCCPFRGSLVSGLYPHKAVPGHEFQLDPATGTIAGAVVPTGHGNSVDRPWRGLVTRDGWKYTCFEQTPWMLYNLNDDPYEQVSLAHNTLYRTQRRALNDRLAAWIADTGDAFALPDLGSS